MFFQNILRRFEVGASPHLLIVIAGVLVRLPLLNNSLAYGTDAWRQADTASIAYHFYINGYKLFYPQIFWGGNGPGYVETEFQLYTFLISILYYFAGEQYWLGKLISLLFSAGAWLFFYPLAKTFLGNERLALWSLGFLVFSPLYIRYSVAYMPEAAVMMFYIAALFYYLKWMSTSERSALIGAAISTALAILVKPTSIHIGLVFLLLGLDKWGRAFFKRQDIYLSAIVALAPGILWYWHARNLYFTYGNTFGLFSGGDSKFGNLNFWLRPDLYPRLAYLDWRWVLGYGAIILFCAGLAVAFKKREFRLIIFSVLTIILYYLIVARYSQEEWGIQYHVYMLPFAALTVGLGIEWISGQNKKNISRLILWLSMGLFFVTTAFFFFQILAWKSTPLETCGNYVNTVVPQNELILVSSTSFESGGGDETNYQDPQIFFYGKRYGWSLPANWHTPEDLVGYIKAGATHFVVYADWLLNDNPSLVDYLNKNSVQVGPGIEEGCAIFRFK